MSLHSRNEYTKGTLDESDIQGDPWRHVELWVQQAVEAGIHDPTAFVLSTLDEQGFPHGRVVLLRETRNGELVFFTNYNSEKGRDVTRTPHAGATFFWPQLERQIRVRGRVHRIEAHESDVYFASRPRASQLGAWSSEQSESVSSRIELENRFEQYLVEFEGREVTRPPHWGGFALKPEFIEFWQGRASRMHDRIRCELSEDGAWVLTRLQP